MIRFLKRILAFLMMILVLGIIAMPVRYCLETHEFYLLDCPAITEQVTTNCCENNLKSPKQLEPCCESSISGDVLLRLTEEDAKPRSNKPSQPCCLALFFCKGTGRLLDEDNFLTDNSLSSSIWLRCGHDVPIYILHESIIT